jgi:exopolyphosphatase/guanosine-5'-triphosphate,3'-diphosphate pyrophosphatase
MLTDYVLTPTIEPALQAEAEWISPMERRIAIIDLGSNTCRLVIFGYSAHLAFKLMDQVSERLRLGEGMFLSDPDPETPGTFGGGPRGAENRLQPEPMARAVQLLIMFRELCEANAIDRVIATATSAVRDATNRDEFLNRVRRETGLALRVLSGEEEAYYAYLGVVNSLAVTNGIIADLGGGSLELVRVRDRLPSAFASLPLGAVRLSEQFLSSDPIKPREAHALDDYIDARLERLKWLPTDGRVELIVLGGTMRTLAKMDQIASAFPLDRMHGYEMSRRALHDQVNELIEQPLKARRKIAGLKDERADVIPAGATVIFRLMKRLGAKWLTVSGQGLREGLFYEEFLRASTRRSRPHAGEGLIPAAPSREGGAPPSVVGLPLVPDVRAFGIANLSYSYEIDWMHAERVCDLSLALFDQLRGLHHFGNPERALLAAAAILHDVGVVIDYYRHHLHSAYVIVNADLPGFTQREAALIALLVRWHRHGTPGLEPFERMLGEGAFERVQKLSAILRLAEDLERSRAQVVQDVRCHLRSQTLEVEALTRGAASAELWAANRDSELFESVYQRALLVTATAIDKIKPRAAPPRENILERAQRLREKLGAPE